MINDLSNKSVFVVLLSVLEATQLSVVPHNKRFAPSDGPASTFIVSVFNESERLTVFVLAFLCPPRLHNWLFC